MGKFLLVVLVIAAVYLVARAYARSARRDVSDSSEPARGEDMVQCLHCGVHLPRSESLQADGGSFCSEEHRRLHSR